MKSNITRLAITALIMFIFPVIMMAQYNTDTPPPPGQELETKSLDYHLEEGFFKLPPGITFGESTGVAIDKRGHIYVFNRGTDPLMEFTEQGDYVQTLAKGIVASAHGLRIDRHGNIWITDVANHTVLRLDKEGHVTMVLGRKGTADETEDLFNQPTDVAFGPDDEIFISDGYGNSRIVKLDKYGHFMKAWGKRGDGPGEFFTPHSLVVGPDNLLYVADRDNLRLQIFDLEGNYIAQWKHAGAPWCLDVAVDGTLWMTDGYANRVVHMDRSGNLLGTFGKPGRSAGFLSFAHGIAAGRSGEVYVSEILSWRVQKFVPGK